MARSFAARAESVVAAGRAPCPFCGGPIDADGHLCPRANGYRRTAATRADRHVRARALHAPRRPAASCSAGSCRASNHTFLTRLGDEGVQCVYKPSSGERPLWDFTDGTLAGPRVRRLGRLGPPGLGRRTADRAARRPRRPGHGAAVDGARGGAEGCPTRSTWCPRGSCRPATCTCWTPPAAATSRSTLVHEDSEPLRRMAVFDIVTNNTDRKGGHVLPMPDGHRYGVDHGVCFHTEDKLRTVLWGWAGQRLSAAETAGVEGVARRAATATCASGSRTCSPCARWTPIERRCERLLAQGPLPGPGGGWPSIPWPPF